MRIINLVGRILFSLIFIVSILGHFSSGEIDAASAAGVPLAHLLVPAAGILALAGGLSVMFGYQARIGGLLLVLFLVPVTLVMHKFWGLSDPHVAEMQRVNFIKNLALLGGALMVMFHGAGPLSVDQRA
jgi:putative oxidoreductase